MGKSLLSIVAILVGIVAMVLMFTPAQQDNGYNNSEAYYEDTLDYYEGYEE